jgi:hypothetical protein
MRKPVHLKQARVIYVQIRNQLSSALAPLPGGGGRETPSPSPPPQRLDVVVYVKLWQKIVNGSVRTKA